MCGIVGYIGKRRAAPVVYSRLKRLEYRGYDSAGLCALNQGNFLLCKRTGRVSTIRDAVDFEGNVAIGHTRWATHGKPSCENAHPHVCGKFALVHNGIVENAEDLKEELLKKGASFLSQTDSEVVVQLLNDVYDGEFFATVYRVINRLEGSYALAIICLDFPEQIIAVRKGSPLVICVGQEECLLASDASALSSGSETFVLQDGEMAILRRGEVTFYGESGMCIDKKPFTVTEQRQMEGKGRYAHFMLKEMAEIPISVAQTLSDCVQKLQFCEINRLLRRAKHVDIVACGTAYHSAIAAKYVIEKRAKIPVEVCVASEYRYKNPIRYDGEIAVAVSQSGETADTLAAARLIKELGIPLIAITNVPYSTLTQIADYVIPTLAGQEVGVAATKSYNAQLSVFFALSVFLSTWEFKREHGLFELSRLCEQVIRQDESVQQWAKVVSKAKSIYFIGRGIDYAVALEGSLKLKELTYLPSEGYAAGELKHGTLALIDENTPVFVILSQEQLAQKTMNAVHEVQSRGARVFFITTLSQYGKVLAEEDTLILPRCEEDFSPLLTVIPLQQLAYFTALALGRDPDKPRNLAKSVTVE